MKYAVPALLAIWLLGCAADEPPPPVPPDLIPVTGTVKMDGKPLEGAVVIFLLQGQGTTSFNVMGGTDAEGKYKLQTRSGQQLHDGAPPGEYKVFISRMVKPDGTPIPRDPATPPAQFAARESIAPKFSNPNQTTLRASVAAGKGPFDFDVQPNPLAGGPPRP